MKLVRGALVAVFACVLVAACTDSELVRAEWLRRLVVVREYGRALEVYSELAAAGRDESSLRHQALLAKLGASGFGPHFVSSIGQVWETSPAALYRDPRFSRMSAAGWAEIASFAEGLAREDDQGLVRRCNAGTRYAASLILVRDALQRGLDPSSALASFRWAVTFCATMPLGSEGRRGLQQISRESARRIEEATFGMDDAELLEWLGASGEAR